MLNRSYNIYVNDFIFHTHTPKQQHISTKPILDPSPEVIVMGGWQNLDSLSSSVFLCHVSISLFLSLSYRKEKPKFTELIYKLSISEFYPGVSGHNDMHQHS